MTAEVKLKMENFSCSFMFADGMRTREQELLGKMKFFYYRTIKCANLLLDKEAMTYKLTQEGEG